MRPPSFAVGVEPSCPWPIPDCAATIRACCDSDVIRLPQNPRFDACSGPSRRAPSACAGLLIRIETDRDSTTRPARSSLGRTEHRAPEGTATPLTFARGYVTCDVTTGPDPKQRDRFSEGFWLASRSACTRARIPRWTRIRRSRARLRRRRSDPWSRLHRSAACTTATTASPHGRPIAIRSPTYRQHSCAR
jgi:hypothetical protein